MRPINDSNISKQRLKNRLDNDKPLIFTFSIYISEVWNQRPALLHTPRRCNW